MLKTLANSATHWRIRGLTSLVCVLAPLSILSVLFLWNENHLTFSILFDFSRYPKNSPELPILPPQNTYGGSVDIANWVSVKLEPEYSKNIISRSLPAWDEGEQMSKTVEIEFLNFDESKPITLSSGNAHKVFFRAIDESRDSHCCGGDYFEIDLASESWKSRPPIKDFGNGTYSFILQVHPDFVGSYNLTIILLFRSFEGLKFLSSKHHQVRHLRRIPIMFSKSQVTLPDLHLCKKSDFSRDLWAGRWTKKGLLGSLESNGWVYSAHCSFKLFSAMDGWNCLNNRWLFFWGDSNNIDTIRNMLFFVLGMPLPELSDSVGSFDTNFTNPKNKSLSVRITNIWSHGLPSLSNQRYRDLLKSFFNGSNVPDTVIFSSGLHDGTHTHKIKNFVFWAGTAAKFWSKMIKKKKVSNFIFRSTIAVGGHARIKSSNPNKMEAFNGVMLEKLRDVGLVTGVIDNFDMTWPWHFDNKFNEDGLHYGRFPSKKKSSDEKIVHECFVDLMLAHILLNAICAK